jgi:hypothetical protein
MKISNYVIFLQVLLMLAGGCEKSISSRILGKWVVDDNPKVLTMEFFSDGRVVSTYEVGVQLCGTWQGQSDTSIAITIESWNITGALTGKKRLILHNGDQEKLYRKIE